MILCVDMQSLKKADSIQKDIDLSDILLNHTRYYDTTEEAVKDKYVPLDFCVSLRSMYSNLVLQIDKGDEKRYYTNLAGIPQFIHKGYDLVMYLASIGLMHSIDYKQGFDELMTKHSQFMVIGIYNPSPLVINPIVYSQVILSDEGAKELPEYLKEDRSLVPISEIDSRGNIQALLDTLIEVKEEEHEE